jgi:protein-S-isoprenylcysteine O-methyltransferase Ste14
LFGYATHINYFGDSVLFVGWAMLAASIFAWAIPVFVTSGFVFFHIPALDKYLSKRYPAEFDDYASKTAKLVPFIY